MPNIYLVYGDLNEKEMNTLYNHDKIKAFVSFTKGEGYGRPIAEFMTTGKPVIVSGWSGHLDFISNDNGFIIPGSLTKVHQSAVWETVINPDSSWFTVDYQSASNLIRGIHSNYKKHSTKSKLTIWDIKNKWSYKKMTERFEKVLVYYPVEFPSQLTIQQKTKRFATQRIFTLIDVFINTLSRPL